MHPFVHDTCLVSSLRSICWILRCGSLDGALYHAGDLVIAWETALFVFVQTSSAHCFGKHLGGMPVSSMSKSSGKKIMWLHFYRCQSRMLCGLFKHLQDNGVAQQQAGKLQDLMGGRQRSSTAWMIAPFIVGRSGWQFDAICDISAGYASFWT